MNPRSSPTSLLIDTHAALWWCEGDRRMPARVLKLLEKESTSIHLGVVSVWEIATKYSLGRLRSVYTPELLIEKIQSELRATMIEIRLAHALESARLPWHHNDPFDRMPIAQATVEGIPILTADEVIARYAVRGYLVR